MLMELAARLQSKSRSDWANWTPTDGRVLQGLAKGSGYVSGQVRQDVTGGKKPESRFTSLREILSGKHPIYAHVVGGEVKADA